MSTIVRKYPALSLVVLAMVLGMTALLAVQAGLLPQGATQLGALSASLAGIVLAAVENRKGGVRDLFGRVLIWRVGSQWWAFALLFAIIPSVAALYMFQLFGGPVVDWSRLKPLPRLQARYTALVSSLIIGLLWGVWHIPLFFTEGPAQSKWQLAIGVIPAILVYVVFCMAWSIQYTWVFNNTKGSVLLAAVMHGAGNAWIGGYIDVYRGHYGGILAFTAMSLIVSIIIVMMAGPKNLSRTNERNLVESESGSSEQAVSPVGI